MDQASSLRKIVNERNQKLKKKVSAQMPTQNVANNSPRVIAVTSGKGGVGKTNIVGNLAVAFSNMGKKVLIFDADLGLANIDIIFGVRPKYNISHVINGEKDLSEVIVETSEGIKIIPAGSGFASLTQLTEGEKLNLLGEFEVFNDSLDFVLIDTGAGISSNVIYFNLAADECVVVATSEPTSLTDAYALMKVMATQHGTKYFKLLVNMVNGPKEAKSVYASLSQAIDRFLKGIILEYIGYIPIDTKLKSAVLNQGPVLKLFPNAKSSQMFNQVSMRLLNSSRSFESDGNIKFFLKKFIDYKKL